MRTAEKQMADPDPARRDAAVRRYSNARGAAARARRIRGRGGGGVHRREPGPAGAGCCPSRCGRCPAGSGAGWNWPGSCSARATEHPAARRADQPSRRRLDRPGSATTCGCSAARLMVISHDADLLDAVVNKVFHLDADRTTLDIYNVGWQHLPGRSGTPTPAAGPARAQQRPAAGRRAPGAGRQDAGQGHQGQGRAEHGAPGRAAARRAGRRTGGRTGGQAALPGARAVREDAADRVAGCPSPTARSRYSPASTWPSTGVRGSWCSA